MFAGIFLPFNLLQTSACIGVIENALLILSRTKIKSPFLRAAFEKSFDMPSDFYAWMPTAHHTNPEVLSMLDEFFGLDYEKMYISSRRERLFYLWGHTFEFVTEEEWSLLDKIGERVAAHPDVWCATNGEIYDYVTAYNSLVYSADNSVVYNPTLLPVWFERDGTLYKIAPGETLRDVKH